MEKQKNYTLDWGGRNLSIKLTDWASQTNGSALVEYGETAVLSTAVMSKNPREGTDFFPLLVDYQEKFYASGRIKGSRFIKREGRPSDEATLIGRVIDRSIRPHFDPRMRNDIQIVANVLSFDNINNSDIPALIGSSIALSMSDIPWNGPIGAVKVGKIDGKFVLNPIIEHEKQCSLLATLAGTKELIHMIEVASNEATEEEVLEAFEFGQKYIKKIIEFQEEILKEHALPKQDVQLFETDDALKKEIDDFLDNRLEKSLFAEFEKEGMDAANDLKKELGSYLKGKYAEKDEENISAGLDYFEEKINALIHKNILEKDRRVDGRKLDEVRALSCEVGVLARTHGSGIFMRGNTHVLGTATLGAPGAEQIIDEMTGEQKKRFMLHYNFPGFSVGEVAFMRSPGRREIGHGALAEKALEPLIPSKEDFPYTIRLVSEILSSNGSSSMASVCAGTLAMMDAGVPLKKPVAGIAMGLMKDESGNFKVLTDIQGPEDHHGDMDFKVAGTADGITAVQMDVKMDGVTGEMLEKTLSRAKKARKEILEAITKTISAPRETLSPYAPRIVIIQINPEKIRDVIGPGGKVINGIIDETGVTSIDIEDDGKIFILGEAGKEESAEKAVARIKDITREIKIGEVFTAKVIKIADFGAFVKLTPRHEGLVHISELADGYVKNVEDIVKLGDTIHIKVIKIDEQGKIGLSAKGFDSDSRSE